MARWKSSLSKLNQDTRSWFNVFVAFGGVLAAFLICVLLRLLELPAWMQYGFWRETQPLLATNDAYYYMASALGYSFETAYPTFIALSRAIYACVGDYLPLAIFFVPALLAPLVILPLAVVLWREGMAEAIVPAGLIAAGTGEYLQRTRLGFYDHDMLVIFLPLCYAAGIYLALAPHVSSRPRSNGPDGLRANQATKKNIFFSSSVLIGLIGWAYLKFYPQGIYLLLTLWSTGFLICLLLSTSNDRRAMLCLGLVPMLVMAFAPLLGLFSAFWGFLVYYYLRETVAKPIIFWALAGLFIVVLLQFVDFAPTLQMLTSKLAYQAEPDRLAQSGRLQLPTFLHTVAEATPARWEDLGPLMAGNWWMFVLGLFGLAAALVFCPALILFSPFLAAGIASVWLGGRFAMYGSAVVGLGVGCGFALALERLGAGRWSRLTVSVLFSAVLLWPLISFAATLKPRPYVSAELAEAMTELRDIAPLDARIWCWWDLGFPVQYYAQRASFADGQRQNHELLYPLGVVHMTTSVRQAANIMQWVTTNQQALRASDPEGMETRTLWAPYMRAPLGNLVEMPEAQAQQFMDQLALSDRQWPKDLREQYLVLTWEMIGFSYFIQMFGTWDLEKKQSMHPGANLDFTDQNLLLPEVGRLDILGQRYPLDTLTHLSRLGAKVVRWPNRSGLHGIINAQTGSGYLIDERLYRSMMVQMLIADPGHFDQYFELVLDHAPNVRVYRLRQEQRLDIF